MHTTVTHKWIEMGEIKLQRKPYAETLVTSTAKNDRRNKDHGCSKLDINASYNSGESRWKAVQRVASLYTHANTYTHIHMYFHTHRHLP